MVADLGVFWQGVRSRILQPIAAQTAGEELPQAEGSSYPAEGSSYPAEGSSYPAEGSSYPAEGSET